MAERTPHRFERRVRYRECDPMGVVYHGVYLDYLEEARTEMFRALGMPYRELEEAGIAMPVIEARLRFRSPARYDDLLEIVTSVDEPPRASIRFSYEVRRSDGDELLADATVVLAFVDRSRGRPRRAPDALSRALEG